jgi:hypothetical protein
MVPWHTEDFKNKRFVRQQVQQGPDECHQTLMGEGIYPYPEEKSILISEGRGTL